MIAITNCEALCAFRSLEEIRTLLRTAPEFAELVGPHHVETFLEDSVDGGEKGKAALRTLFSLLMNADTKRVTTGVEELCKRVSNLAPGTPPLVEEVEQLAVRLNKQFPGALPSLLWIPC